MCSPLRIEKLSKKGSKSLFGALPKTSKWLPNWSPETLGNNVALQHPWGSQKEHFFLPRSPMEEATDHPKIVSKSFQNDTKSKLHGICLMVSIFVRFGVSAARL